VMLQLPFVEMMAATPERTEFLKSRRESWVMLRVPSAMEPETGAGPFHQEGFTKMRMEPSSVAPWRAIR